MGARHWKILLIALTASVAMAAPAGAQSTGNRAYDRGYREGVEQGTQDARDGHTYAIEGNRIYRDGDRGWDNRDGGRDWYRNEFRRGFSSGYREGFDRVRVNVQYRDDRWDRGPRGYQEPAFARGYSDGRKQGIDDGHDRDRYDPVRHGDYRSADHGYERSYGSKDAYKNNYRSGFRQGYEDGYRDGVRRGR
ncbi:MAG TPA: hypothetical protein VGF24_35325 [Vicinamibacterales bacterium]|jgi:hypothetical protein